jgi:hypothetical protein
MWLCALFLSFCYELPLYQLTQMDRLNPRLFDLVAVAGGYILLFQSGNLRRARNNPIFRRWMWLMIWFSVCAAIWAALWLPWGPAGKYSVYFALKYIEGLFCIYLVAAIPLSPAQKHRLHWMIVIGGIVVASYAVLEKMRGQTVRFITEGKEITRAEGTLFSCLGPTYFHVATFSVLSCAMTFALANRYPASLTKMFLYGTALVVGWPAVFCGSRVGLGMLLIVLAGVFFFMERTRLTLLLSGTMAVLAVGSMFSSEEFVEKSAEMSRSVDRLLGSESSHGGANSIGARLSMGMDGLLGGEGDSYSWQGKRLPLFGGGFYAVPHSSSGRIIKYRTGYGVHNAYLFAYEQAGIIGAVLAGLFVYTTIRTLLKMIRAPGETDRQFALGAWCLTLAFIPAAWFGQIFWRGFGTENFNTYLLIILTLAATHTTVAQPRRPAMVPSRPWAHV